MITDLILSAFTGIILGLFEPLPVHPVDTSVIEGQTSQIGAMASALNGYAPIGLLGACLAVLLTLKVALLAWRGVLFVYHQFWGSY